MSELSPEQAAVLETIQNSRLTVIRAGPGSGKTKVFVEALKRSLDTWRSPRSGLAALSFTNVAHEVITKRLGGPLGAPHFVGTLDSFLLRFVVRPFGHLVGVSNNGARLVPAPVDSTLSHPKVRLGSGPQDQTPLYRVSAVAGDEASPRFSYRLSFGQPREVPVEFRAVAQREKWRLWSTKGLVTHSDSHHLASALLRSSYKEQIVRIIVKRFPLVLVDEFQDTGWFLGRALLEILRSPDIRGVVVGDPDQSIYQFGGANRTIFDQAGSLSGATSATLATSHRCSARVALVSSEFSRTKKTVIARPQAPIGRAVMLVHDQDLSTLNLTTILTACADLVQGREVGVLVRRRGWVDRLVRSEGSKADPPWVEGSAARLLKAAQLAVDGEPSLAVRIVQQELAALILDDESLTGYELGLQLAQRSISTHDWRSALHSILIEAVRSIASETWNQRVMRLKAAVDREATQLGWNRDVRALGAKFRAKKPEGDNQWRFRHHQTEGVIRSGTELMTIHAAKGREFDSVIVIAPKPHRQYAPCPSKEWWSQDETSEEREVAFVACSRAKSNLVLAIHKQTHDALKRSYPAFYSLFEKREVDATTTQAETGKAPRTKKKQQPIQLTF